MPGRAPPRFGSVNFSLLRVDTGQPSLFVASDACDNEVGKSHWDRYPLR